MTALRSVDAVLALFRARGEHAYLGEAVTMSQHMLQAASLAEGENAAPSLVAAALLHDVGHLLQDEPVDDHEDAGAALLDGLFPPVIAACARLHVPAKRYLVATDPDYAARLSPESVRTLALQGGAMRDDQVAAFRATPFFAEAVRVRGWDDRAKDVAATTKPFGAYVPLLRSLANERPS